MARPGSAPVDANVVRANGVRVYTGREARLPKETLPKSVCEHHVTDLNSEQHLTEATPGSLEHGCHA